MAAPATLPALLDSLTQSLNSAFEATPKLSGLAPPKDGLSLLDVKNDLLLSYLQNLVFLILLKLRNAQSSGSDDEDASELKDTVVKKLVELRLYTEKGVRPLEDKLRYQIEKALRAADDAERNAKADEASKNNQDSEEEEEESGSDDAEDDSDQDEAIAPIADLKKSLPNRAAFVRPSHISNETDKGTDGVYRPPKIAPTVMPTTERRERTERRPLKSATMDEFIADEFSTAPSAEPSIGTNIRSYGRSMKTASERKAEDERRDYEEKNFVRLPKESKDERAKKAQAAGRTKRMNFGGEEWRELGEGVDRIHQLTKTKGSTGGTKALLEKSRKRGIETTDGPRGSGSGAVEIGDRYNKRLKVQELGRRDRGKRR